VREEAAVRWLAFVVLLLADVASAAPGDELEATVPHPKIPWLDAQLGPQDPQPTDFMRWPLPASRHPSLDPTYPIATALAADGVSWQQLCARGAQSRTSTTNKELNDYLRAWCQVAIHDTESALDGLAPLQHTKQAQLRLAVRIDLASILVDIGPADRAEQALGRHNLGDLALYDLLAGAYGDLGRSIDANRFNDLALAENDRSSTVDHCHRLARRYLLAPPEDKEQRYKDFREFRNDRACSLIEHELDCSAHELCGEFRADHPVPTSDEPVRFWYVNWPETPVSASTWDYLVDQLQPHLDYPGGDVVLASVIQGAMASRYCTDAALPKLRALAARIKALRGHDRSIDKQLAGLVPNRWCHP
jgi:hypothetical protein